MRVLHLLDPAVLRATDYRSRTLALIDQLRAQGVHTVHLAGPERMAGMRPAEHSDVNMHAAMPERPGSSGLHIYRTHDPERPRWLPRPCAPVLSITAWALRLRQVARLTRPDLIHVHASNWNALAALPAACGGALPLIAETERRLGSASSSPGRLSGFGAGSHLWERWALTRARALAAPSLEMRAALRGAGLGGRRIAVIPPAADVDANLTGMARTGRMPRGLEGAPLLGYAGRLEHNEGIDLLLSILPALRRRYPALRLVVAGGGAREDELAARIHGSNARGHVVFTGALPSRRAADVLPRADIAVFPALPGGSAELAPSRHLMNAMAQGCAIVASDIACHRELLTHGHSGMLFHAGSRAALAEMLLGLLDCPERQRALGTAAAICAASRHSWTVTAASYRRLYEDVLTQGCKH